MISTVAKRDRSRRGHVPDILSIPVEGMLANAREKYYLAYLSPRTDLCTLAAIKARWVCEHADQQMKEELDL
jgi:hypothetical protein